MSLVLSQGPIVATVSMILVLTNVDDRTEIFTENETQTGIET